MRFLTNPRAAIENWLVRRLPDHRIIVENALRAGEPTGGSASTGIVPEAISQRAVSLQEWTSAVTLARHPLQYSRRQLAVVYDNVLLDLHLSSIIDKRTERLLADKFKITGPDGNEVPELASLLQAPWFRDFITYAMESVMHGHSLIELFDQATTPTSLKVGGRTVQYFPLRTVKLVPRAHVKPELGVWLKHPYDMTGPNFREDSVRNFYLEVGKPDSLGLLMKLTPVALAKRYAMGSWSEFNEKLAIPFRWVTMKSPDKKREEMLARILAGMGSAGWGIFHGQEEIKLLESAKSDPHKCFLELLNFCDRQMSKAVLGETLTTDEGSGSYAQGKVHADVAELKHEADRTFLEYLINTELIPRLVWLGYPLVGCRFERDESLEMTPTEQIEIDAQLLQFYNIDPEYIADKYGIPLAYLTSKSADEVKNVLKDAASKKDKPVAVTRPLLANDHAGCCGDGRAMGTELPVGATVRMSDDEEAYLRRFYDDAGSRGWSYEHFQRNHSQLMQAVSEGMPAKDLTPEYSSPDHLTRANFEADVHQFGHDKTVYQVLELNRILKASGNFNDFKAEAGKLLTNLNERNLRTEYEMAKGVSVGAANAMRAIRDGAKFMRYKATLDDRTRPFHAMLNDKVFRIDGPDQTWRKLIVPLGWRCRCQNIYFDDHRGEVSTYEDAEQLLGTTELERLKKDGFLFDRLDRRILFTNRQTYLNGLQDPDKVKFQVGKLKYSDQGQQPWAKMNKADLPQLVVPKKSVADALADFKDAAADDRKLFTDHQGRPLFLNRTDLETHLADKYTTEQENRQGLYFKIGDVLSEPDEVYFSDKNNLREGESLKLGYTYLKFYQDQVLLVAVEFDQDEPLTVKTWYKVDEPDNRRKGLLVYQKTEGRTTE